MFRSKINFNPKREQVYGGKEKYTHAYFIKRGEREKNVNNSITTYHLTRSISAEKFAHFRNHHHRRCRCVHGRRFTTIDSRNEESKQEAHDCTHIADSFPYNLCCIQMIICIFCEFYDTFNFICVFFSSSLVSLVHTHFSN